MNETEQQQLCEAGDVFYARGDAFGGTGNLSLRVQDGVWITPTGMPLKGLTPGLLAHVDMDGAARNENKPSKEYPFHLAIYQVREDVHAVVHLHSPHAVAVSCLESLNTEAPLPPITPYYLMRVAPLGVVPYFRPGSPDLAVAVSKAIQSYDCLLLRNHGLICTGASFPQAVERAIELEETARLYFILRGEHVRTLTESEQEELRRVFGAR